MQRCYSLTRNVARENGGHFSSSHFIRESRNSKFTSFNLLTANEKKERKEKNREKGDKKKRALIARARACKKLFKKKPENF